MQSTPRFLLVSSRTFDGSTTDPGTYVPGINRLEPRCYELIPNGTLTGWFPFNKLARPGTHGLVAYIRCHGEPAPGDRIEVRSRKGTEGSDVLPDLPDPPLVDWALLETRPLLTTWVGPFLLGPTDGFGIEAEDERNIEYLLYDLDDEGFRALLQSPAFAIQTMLPAVERRIYTETADILPWVGTLYASGRLEGDDNVLTLPLASVMRRGDKMILDRQGVDLFRVVPETGDKINGLSEALGARVLMKESNGGVIFERVDDDNWFASADSRGPASLAIVAAGPVPTFAGDIFIEVALAAFGGLVLPPTDQIGEGQRCIFTNRGPAGFFVQLSVPASERIDGVLGLNAGIIKVVNLPLVGDTVIFERHGTAGWTTSNNLTDLWIPCENTTNVNIIFTQGWRGHRTIRLTNNAAMQTLTLPPFAVTPQGCELFVIGTDIAPTIQTSAGAEDIIGKGATGTSVVLADNETWGHFVFNGSEWMDV